MFAYNNNARECAFLLGGIGTGNISLGAGGDLRDLEIFNSPNKGKIIPFTFFSVWMKQKGKKPIAKKLESWPDYSNHSGHGFHSSEVKGIPYLDSSTMKVEYPFANITFSDEDIPVDIKLEAFTPFIPLNASDSGIPGAVLAYKVKNNSTTDVEVSIAASMANMLGNKFGGKYGNYEGSDEGQKNIFKDTGNLRGIRYLNESVLEDKVDYGEIFLATTSKKISKKTIWLRSGWFDGIHDFWDDFRDDGKLEEVANKTLSKGNLDVPSMQVGSVAAYNTIRPGQEKTFQFMLTWYFPNRIKGWSDCDCDKDSCTEEIVRNFYATKYKDAVDVAEYLSSNLKRLEKESRDFSHALYSSTLPKEVLDAISANITVLRSPTCFRIEDGTFLGWEGCCNDIGCCPGSCTHVWNYAQTVAFLFPELEQSVRKVEFALETNQEGKMNFRSIKAIREKSEDSFWEDFPAADGQMGSIIRLCREVKLSGDIQLLKELWPKVKLAIDYAFNEWDTDGDYMLDSKKHNTYDIEFYGAEPLSNILFLGALKAVVFMAEALNDPEAQLKYREIFETARKNIDELLWSGQYYIQKIGDINKYKYQFGTGCLSDQLLGQTLAHICGLGYLLPEEHVNRAIKSVYDNNFRDSLKSHNNLQRSYALKDEAGLLICSWPQEGRPDLPFVYSDEIWSGIEYQVATLLIYEGYIEEAFKIVKAVRDRYDGIKRNPFDEMECGHHYARSMASWGLIIALSGFECDLVKGKISFSPRINSEDFSGFFSMGKAWGIYRQKINKETNKMKREIEVLYGSLDGVDTGAIIVTHRNQ